MPYEGNPWWSYKITTTAVTTNSWRRAGYTARWVRSEAAHLPGQKEQRVMSGGLGSQSFAPILVGIALICLVLTNVHWEFFFQPQLSFVQRNGTQFVVDGKPFYVNGWNSYWLMAQGVDFTTRSAVKTVLQRGAEMGLSVCRTWAFYDGVDGLQPEPGHYSEDVFRALDYTIVEARRHGVRLLLSLVNNLPAFGGKGQYVEWARDAGADVGSSNDSFYTDPTVRGYYKHYMKAIMTRVNSISGISYRDEPTIFAWELINEPRCPSDLSGDILQDWIEEMAAYAKSLDQRHLLTIGLEGFYGKSTPDKLEINPGDWVKNLGSDFIRHSKAEFIDFASVHAYPDIWTPNLLNVEKIKFAEKWVASHIADASEVLQKPVLFTEFGVSNQARKFEVKHIVEMLNTVYSNIYDSAKGNGAGAGALVWQFLVEGADRFRDEFTLIPWQEPVLYGVILEQSCKLYNVSENYNPTHPTCTIKDNL